MIESVYRYGILPAFETGWKRRKTFRHLKSLSDSQWWQPRRLRRWQLQRLKELLQHCELESPFYHDHWRQNGVHSSDLHSLDDLSRWPLTTRDMLRQHEAEIRVKRSTMATVRKSTGGSSGTPLRFEIDHEANDRRCAAALRGYQWASAGPGTKQSYLWGVNLQAMSPLRRVKELLYARFLHRRDMLNSFQMSARAMGNYVDRINRFKPRAIVGYTNPLYCLAQEIHRHDWEIHRPRSIIVGAEKLYDFQRKLIEQVFGAPVYETYGSREFTLIGAECERHEGLHVTMENLIVEIVDDRGQPVADGEEGQIVITDLFNFAMPFVRYPIGDRAIGGWQQCSCGRGLPLMRQVVGRQLDVLRLSDGRILPGEFFPHLLKDYSEIRQFQVVQTDRDELELRIIVGDGWGTSHGCELNNRIQQCLGESVKCKIEQVSHLPLTPAGKRRVVIGLPAEKTEALSRSA